MTDTTTHHDLRAFLELLYRPGDVFEVRAPKCRQRPGAAYTSTVSGYFTFDAIDRAVSEISLLDESGLAPGIYATLNPVHPDLLARASNRLRRRANETTADGDVVRREWLLVDVDPIRPSGVSATDPELALAIDRAGAIRQYLSSLGWPEPVQAMSGNGAHLLYRIDLPVEDDDLVRRVLAALADRFDDARATVDRSVFNPARIVKIIGTVARKGDDLRGVVGVADRLHRRSRLLEVPDTIAVVPAGALRAVGGPETAPAQQAATRASGAAPGANGGGNGRFPSTPEGVRAWLEARGVAVTGLRRNGDKTLLLLERCPVDPEIVATGGSDIAVLVGDDGRLAYCNKHNRGQGYTWHDLRRAGETMNVIASPKTGKSWLVLDLAIAVSTGRPWLGVYETVPGDVLIIDNELHRETSAHRIPRVAEARGVPLSEIDDRIFVENIRGRLQDIFTFGPYFEALEPGRFKVIVLDAFYRFMPRGGDENDNGTMANIYNAIDHYADRLGCSFVLIHHSTKGSQSAKSVTDVGAGAGSQSRATDTHLVLRPHEEAGVVVLDAAVRSWPPIEPVCLRWAFPVWHPDTTLDPADLRVESPRKQKDKTPAWTAERFVAQFVTESPACREDVIERAQQAGLSQRQAKALLRLSEARGGVHRWVFGPREPVLFASIPQPAGSNGCKT